MSVPKWWPQESADGRISMALSLVFLTAGSQFASLALPESLCAINVFYLN